MTPTKDARGEPVEAAAPGTGPFGETLLHGKLTNAIIGAMFEVDNVLGAGFLESDYANALAIELRLRGIPVERNVPFNVLYRGAVVGRYVADLVVDQKVIVETKVAKAIDPVHHAQLSELSARVRFGSRAGPQLLDVRAIQACRGDVRLT